MGKTRPLGILGILIFLLLTGEKCSEETTNSDSLQKAESQDDFHQLEFGMSVGFFKYLKNQDAYEGPLKRMANDGIRHVRGNDPFTTDMQPYLKKIPTLIESVTKHDIEFLLSISNYPYPVKPAHIQPWVAKAFDRPEYASKGKARKEKYNRQIQNKSKWTNRFPPEDLDAYGDFLESLVNKLIEKDVLKNTSFEIGNEPNAPIYYWGSAAEFKQIVHKTHEVLKETKRPIVCCAFTGKQVMENEWNRESDFYQFSYSEPLFKEDLGFSFHLYQGHGVGDWKDFESIEHDFLEGSYITETNVYGGMADGTPQLEKANSPFWIVRFAQMLEFAYKHKIERIYFHKLKDQPGIKGKLGFFDVKGKAKPSYEYFLKVKSVIDDGYKLEINDDYIQIVGKKKTLIVALNETDYQSNWGSPSETSSQTKTSEFIPKDEWVIINN